MKYEFIRQYPWIRIEINGFPHLQFKEADFIGYQSWVMGNDLFCIEYYFKGNQTILCEYDLQEKWSNILEILKDKL